MKLNALHVSPPQLATVLVVDADVVFREFEARTLINKGYTVLKAGTKEEAIRFARQNANIALLVLGTPLQEPDRLAFNVASAFRFGARRTTTPLATDDRRTFNVRKQLCAMHFA